MTPAETRAALVEAMARVLHMEDIAQAERRMKAEGAVPPERWADPWCPGSERQLVALRQRAQRLLSGLASALAELGLKIVPEVATEEMNEALVETVTNGTCIGSNDVVEWAPYVEDRAWSAMLAAAPDVLESSGA